MKKRIITGILLTLAFQAYSQKMDTVKLSRDIAASLLFEGDVKLVVFGNNPTSVKGEVKEPLYYQYIQDGNTLIIRARSKDVPFTTLMVKYGEAGFFQGIIKYAEHPGNTLYDLRMKKIEDSKTEYARPASEKKTEKVSDNKVKERLHEVIDGKDIYSTFGTIKGPIAIGVTNMANDREFTYLKIKVNNQSSAEYKIDDVLFRYTEVKTGSTFTRKFKNREDLFPKEKVNVKLVPAYSTETIGFAIPLFATGDQGKLIIIFRELSGSRNINVEIASKDLQKIKIF